MTDLNATLFSKPKILLSRREQLARQIIRTERALKSCLEAMKKSYDMLWQKQSEYDFLVGRMQKLEKEKTAATTAELNDCEKELAQLKCDMEHLKANLEKNKPQVMVQRLQQRLALLKAKEQPRETEPGFATGIPSPSGA